MLLKDSKRGPAEGQVTGLGLQLHGVVRGLHRILGMRKLSSVTFPSLETVLGQVTGKGVTEWARPALVGSSYLCPIHDRRGLSWQELKGSRLALLRVGGMDDSQVLLGAHHATRFGHRDCCLQVVPWGCEAGSESNTVQGRVTLTPP